MFAFFIFTPHKWRPTLWGSPQLSPKGIIAKKMKKKSAFSLIELSVVLTIISIIISGAVTVSQTAIKNAKIEVTNEKLAKIQEAIEIYLHKNKHLPCPASLTNIPTDTAYGTKVGTDGTCDTGTSDGIITSSTISTLVYGAVPVKELGLPIDYLGDGFDNKFSYIVPVELTQTYVDYSNLGFEGTDMTNTNNSIAIEERISSGSTITNIAAYVILSHGVNGYGAFNIYSQGTQNSLSSDDDEDDNDTRTITAEEGIYDRTFVVESNSSDFDDILIYNIRESLMHKSNVFQHTYCRQEESIYTIQASCANGISLGNVTVYYGHTNTSSCSGVGTCIGGNIYLECGLYGQWNNTDDCF